MAAMEDVLALYALPFDERYPTVCLDEKPVVLHADVRAGLPPAPGHFERRDDEYERHGTANLFVIVEPLAGWRHVAVTAQRIKRDYAECLRYLEEERYPQAECICGVHDNPNTHMAGALYETFPHRRPVASCRGSRSITRPSTAAGSIRPRSRSASSSAAASRARWRTQRP